MNERTEEIDSVDGKIYLTERELKHPKSGKMTNYISLSDGTNVAGVYINEKARKEIIRFLTPKKGA